jgi:methyltransferase (TIGR00027 family)
VKAGNASVTAQRVAALRLSFDRVGATYGDPTADERLARDVAGALASTPRSPMERYLQARTAFFDRVVVSAVDRGMPQVVVAAAGYDGRALRYAKHGVRWFEIDHPDTQRDKRARLERLGIDTSAITFVAADFAVDDIATAMAVTSHDRTRPSLILCEGVAVYLDRAVLEALLRGLATIAVPGSRMAISLSASSESPALAARRADFQRAVAAVGEPARTVLAPGEADTLLAATGWQRQVAAGDDAERRARAARAGFVVAEPVARTP